MWSHKSSSPQLWTQGTNGRCILNQRAQYNLPVATPNLFALIHVLLTTKYRGFSLHPPEMDKREITHWVSKYWKLFKPGLLINSPNSVMYTQWRGKGDKVEPYWPLQESAGHQDYTPISEIREQNHWRATPSAPLRSTGELTPPCNKQ